MNPRLRETEPQGLLGLVRAPVQGQAAGEQRGPLTWQEEEGKGPCWAAGEGQRVRHGRPRQRATGIEWGWARSAQDPRWKWGFSGGSGSR